MGRLDRATFQQRLETMIRQLREDILTGQRKAGEYLPSEVTLGKMYGLSNKSVRTGLSVLVEEGLIQKIPRVGNLVTLPAGHPKVVQRLRLITHNVTERDLEFSALLRAFEQKYPDIQVQVTTLPSSRYSQTVKQQIEAGTVDAFMISTRDFQQFKEWGDLELLESFEPEHPDRIYPFVSGTFMHEGRLKAKSVAFSPIVLLYNVQHFRETGISEPDSGWTWDDLLRAAKRLERPGERLGFYFHLTSYNRWPIFLLQQDVQFSHLPDGRLAFDRGKFLEAIRTCRTVLDHREIIPAFLSENDGDAEQLFLKEKVSMILTSYFSLNKLKSAGLPIDVSPLPYSGTPKTMLLTVGLAVCAHSQAKPAALKLAEFVSSEEAQHLIRRSSLSLPAARSAAEQRCDGREPSRFHLYREIIPAYRTFAELGLSVNELHRLASILKLYWAYLENETIVCARVERLNLEPDGDG